MRSVHDENARGWWQFVVFALALVLAYFVWYLFPEPEESLKGYTAAGCYEKARDAMEAAAGSTGDRRWRTRAHVTAIRYLEAMEKRFGIDREHWDAYEMLGDARRELASMREIDRDVVRRFRLPPARESREEALRAYREGAARLEPDSFEELTLLRKQAEMLLELGRAGEASAILRRLWKHYRQDEVHRLMRERGQKVERGEVPRTQGADAARLAEEGRRVYFLAGRAALAQGNVAEAEDAFDAFLDAGGSGEKRAYAETALGDLAFAAAVEAEPEAAGRLFALALGRYKEAGTPRAAFRGARCLFRMGEYERALKSFTREAGDTSASERRARRYMAARCLLALGRPGEAAEAFRSIREDSPEDAEGVASLVGLADIAVARGEHEEAAGLYLDAAGRARIARSGTELPERDRELGPSRLADRLLTLADAFEKAGRFERAIDVCRSAGDLDRPRQGAILRRIARTWERKAETCHRAEAGPAGDARARHACAMAAKTYLDLAEVLENAEEKRACLVAAAERFAEGGEIARAVETARLFVREHPTDEFASATSEGSRMLWNLGRWELALGLADEADAAFERNTTPHAEDVYADRSLVARVKALISRGDERDMEKAAGILREILHGKRAERYAEGTLVRLEALFLLGRVAVRLAEARAEERRVGARGLFAEALDALDQVRSVRGSAAAPHSALRPMPVASSQPARQAGLRGGMGGPPQAGKLRNLPAGRQGSRTVVTGRPPETYPAEGAGARPRFRALVDREWPRALLARGRALLGLGRSRDAREALAVAREAAERLIGDIAPRGEHGKVSAREVEAAVADERRRELRAIARDAAFYEALAAYRAARADEGKPLWRPARDMVDGLAADAGSVGILPEAYWRGWSDWIDARAREGRTDAGAE